MIAGAVDLRLAAAVMGRAVGRPGPRRQLGQSIPGRRIAGLELDPALQRRSLGEGVTAQGGEPGDHRGYLCGRDAGDRDVGYGTRGLDGANRVEGPVQPGLQDVRVIRPACLALLH